MRVEELPIKGVLKLTPKVYKDNRGLFLETWQKTRYEEFGVPTEFVQDNLSISSKNVLRGLHFQKEHPQGKLITLLKGKIFDVVVDLRKDSPTFGQWAGTYLSAENFEQLWIPPGLAHGFLVCSDEALFNYKCTEYYYPQDEKTILWNDTTLGMEWPLSSSPILSAKDECGTSFENAAK